MTEFAYVEKPILNWLSGDPSTSPNDKGLGWTYRGETAMEAFGRPVEDPLIEAVLIPALQRVNPGVVSTDAQAKMAIATLRSAMNWPDRLEALAYAGVGQEPDHDLCRQQAAAAWETG